MRPRQQASTAMMAEGADFWAPMGGMLDTKIGALSSQVALARKCMRNPLGAHIQEESECRKVEMQAADMRIEDVVAG